MNAKRNRRQGSRPPGRGRQGSPQGRRQGSGPARRQRSGPTDRQGGRRPARRGLGGDQVEGRHAVRELLLAGRRAVREVFIVDDLDQADIIDDIRELATDMNVPVRSVNRRRLANEAATSSHQGVMARADPLTDHDLSSLVEHVQPFLLVLDGVTDPGNLGAVVRTAECAGVTGIVLPRHRAAHISPTVTKAAAGAIEHVPMSIVGGVPNALSYLSDNGVVTIGLDAAGDRTIFDADPGLDRATGGVALVLGAEGRGLSRLVRQRVDMVVAIPLQGELNSLNVAAASAVACFEIVRRLRTPPADNETNEGNRS